MSEEYLKNLLQHQYEQQRKQMGYAADDNWPQWYAQYMLQQMQYDFGTSPKNPLGM